MPPDCNKVVRKRTKLRGGILSVQSYEGKWTIGHISDRQVLTFIDRLDDMAAAVRRARVIARSIRADLQVCQGPHERGAAAWGAAFGKPEDCDRPGSAAGGKIHYLSPLNAAPLRGAIVVVQWRAVWWSVELRLATGGRRLISRTNWTQRALDIAVVQAWLLGVRAVFVEDV